MAMPRGCLFEGDDGGQNQLFHCVSRVVDRRRVFGPVEKTAFARLLRRAEAFSGVTVVTWTILDNHFHVLVHITPRPEGGLGEREILARVRRLYPRCEAAAIEAMCGHLRESAPGEVGEGAVTIK